MHYQDLTPCDYFDCPPEVDDPGSHWQDKLTAIGWLESGYPFLEGDVDAGFLNRLMEMLISPWNAIGFFGYHTCDFCSPIQLKAPTLVTYGGRTITAGVNNIFIPGQKTIYVAPSLIAHYILNHHYLPPLEFQTAVVECPPMESREYLDGPPAHLVVSGDLILRDKKPWPWWKLW